MNKLLQWIEEAVTIGISGHIRPDGDCVGSCLGLYNYIRENYSGKQVEVYLERIPETFHFLSGSEEIKHQMGDRDKVYDLFCCLDCGSIDRLGDFMPLFQNAERNLVVDHHVSNTNFGMLNLVEEERSSTSEFLYTFLDPEKVSKNTAEALYLGLIHDTGVFKHSCATKDTMRIAGELMEKGVPFSRLIDETFYQKTYLQNQILGRCLLESFLLLHGKVIASCIEKKILDFYEAKPNDLDGVVDQLRITKGVEVAVLAYETSPGECKISMRSNGSVDVSRIAIYFGGGGHIRAAGCSMRGSYHDVITNITGHIESQLKLITERETE